MADKILINPVLNDFIYTLLFESPYELKRGLKGKFLKAAVNSKSAKIFSTTSTREEKEYIMSHMGIEYFYVIAKKGMSLQNFKGILEKFESSKKVSALQDISRQGVFVTSDKEFLRLLGLMSQSIHHPAFFLNLELNRQGYSIKKWPKKNLNQQDLLVRELDENAKVISKTILNSCVSMDYCRGLTGVSDTEMKILLYLYNKSHTYIPNEQLLSFFAGNMSKTKYRGAVKRLLAGQLIQKHGAIKELELTITGPGVRQVNNFINNVINSNNF